MAITESQESKLNKMNRASQDVLLGTIIQGLQDITGSTSASSVQTNLTTHIGQSGSVVHGLGTMSQQNSNSVNITSGSIGNMNWPKKDISVANSPYSVLSTDFTLRCNANTGSIIVNLLPAIGSGRIFHIKSLYTSACIVRVVGDITGTPDLIDGEASMDLPVKTNMSVQDGATNYWDII